MGRWSRCASCRGQLAQYSRFARVVVVVVNFVLVIVSKSCIVAFIIAVVFCGVISYISVLVGGETGCLDVLIVCSFIFDGCGSFVGMCNVKLLLLCLPGTLSLLC